MKQRLTATLFSFALVSTCWVQAAKADWLNYAGLYYGGPDTVQVINGPAPGPSMSERAYSGGFNMQDTSASWMLGAQKVAQGQSFIAYCLDIYDNMGSASYTLTPGPSYGAIAHNTLTAAKVLELERLASNNMSQVVDAKSSSAFQLAQWEIMAEAGPSLGMHTGTFSVANDAQGADALADQWLGSLGNAAPALQLYIWRADMQGSTQDLAVYAPVPEPAALLLTGLGFAALGFLAKRRAR